MDILMPQLGETVAEGTVTNWYKKVGDPVKADEALFDVETDKVATEIPCPVSGVLTEVLVAAGQTVKVGTRLAVVTSAAESAASAQAGGQGSASLLDSRVRGNDGGVGSGRSDLVAPAQAGGQGSASLLDSSVRGNDGGVGSGRSDLVAPAQSGAQSSASHLDSRVRGNDGGAHAGTPGSVASASGRDASRQKLSPVVRRLLAEHRLDASAIRGSGRDGRVTRDDVLAHLRLATPAAAQAPHASPASPGAGQWATEAAPGTPQLRSPLPPGEGSGVREEALPASHADQPPADQVKEGERIVALNNIRRRSAAAMARAWQAVPHVLQAVEADYSRIEQTRRARQAAWQAREGFELTYLPFLAWAVCQALQRYEQLNARIAGDSLIVSSRVHLGIAVDLNHEGLVVPVIRDAQDRNIAALAREIRRIAVAARGGKLKPDDLSQPTYTISNSGVFGTLITAPIVNPPQVAILSTDGVSKRPVVVESPEGDSIAVRPVGVLAQSFDHRAVDGAYSAAFLKELKRIVEGRAWIEDIG